MIATLFVLIMSGGAIGANSGENSFQLKCAACHSIGGGDQIGPDLMGVTKRRDPNWLSQWIIHPDKMLNEKDPIAMELLKKYNQVPMPNLGVTEAEARDLIDYIAAQSETQKKDSAVPAQQTTQEPPSAGVFFGGLKGVQLTALVVFFVLSTIVVFVFWQIAKSTRQPVPTIDMKSAYKLRKWFFFGTAVLVFGTLIATLPKTPYPDDFQTPDRLVYVAAKQFGFSFSSEPITSASDAGQSTIINSLELPQGALIEFRVTSLDVNHGFALYDADHSIIAQTQAMPGYTNRLRVRFPKPGTYQILCLEYCGLAHHLMHAAVTVR